MRVKIFAILIGSVFGIIVYAFIGYVFTKKLPLSKKYKSIFVLFLLIFILLLFLYFKF